MSHVVLTQPHNQAKSWEYFHNFIAAVGIYFLVYNGLCMHNHNQAKLWEYFRNFVAVMGIYFLMSCSHLWHIPDTA